MAVKMKRSGVAGKVPTTTQLELGELAVNTYDGRLFLKKDDGTEAVVEIVNAGRLISAGTGLTGGGSLAANRTLSANIASQAEAEAGTVSTKLMTPERVAQAIAAQASSGLLSDPGYTILSSGLMLQWGRKYVSAGSLAFTSFPTSFPNACFRVFTTIESTTYRPGNRSDYAVTDSWTASGTYIRVGLDYSEYVQYLAIGY